MTSGDTTARPPAPFPGPLPFLRTDEPIFCGRDRETRDLLDMLLAYRMTVLYAQSGAGKTSLVNAGLRPLLEREGFRVVRARVIDDGRATPDLAIPNRFVWNAIQCSVDADAAIAAEPGMTISSALKQYPPGPLLFIVDQLEELFLPVQDGVRLRREFFAQIKAAFEGSKAERVADLHVLYVIREEYFPRLDRYAGVIPHACNIRYYLDRLTASEARRAIEDPLGKFGYTISSDALDGMIVSLQTTRDASGALRVSEFVEPLELQIVCDQLWQKLDKTNPAITAAEVSSYADVRDAARAYYERALDRVVRETGVAEAKLRAWCSTALITAAGTRNLIFAGQTETQGLPNRAIDLLVRDRLVREESRSTGTWYELSHDRFVEAVRVSNEQRERRLDRTLIRTGKLALPILLGALTLLGVVFAWHQHGELREAEAQNERTQREMRKIDAAREAQRASDHAEAQARVTSLKTQQEELQRLLKDQAEKQAASEQALAGLSRRDAHRMKALGSQIKESKERSQALAIQSVQLATQIATAQGELSSTKDQLVAATQTLDQTRSEQRDLNAQLDVCHDQLTGVLRDLAAGQAARASCLLEADSLQSRTTTQEQVITKCTSDKATAEQALATVNDKIAACAKCNSYMAGGPCPP